MELGERVDPEQPALLIQAHGCAVRLHEVLKSHDADLLRHVESAEKSACQNDSPSSRLSLTEPDATALREGAHRVQRAADAAARLIDGLSWALRDNECR
jgi:hypothetical protein